MMFYFESILQIWIVLIGFRDTNDFVNLGICKHEFTFTCRGCCRFTLNGSGGDQSTERDIPRRFQSGKIVVFFKKKR